MRPPCALPSFVRHVHRNRNTETTKCSIENMRKVSHELKLSKSYTDLRACSASCHKTLSVLKSTSVHNSSTGHNTSSISVCNENKHSKGINRSDTVMMNQRRNKHIECSSKRTRSEGPNFNVLNAHNFTSATIYAEILESHKKFHLPSGCEDSAKTNTVSLLNQENVASDWPDNLFSLWNSLEQNSNDKRFKSRLAAESLISHSQLDRNKTNLSKTSVDVKSRSIKNMTSSKKKAVEIKVPLADELKLNQFNKTEKNHSSILANQHKVYENNSDQSVKSVKPLSLFQDKTTALDKDGNRSFLTKNPADVSKNISNKNFAVKPNLPLNKDNMPNDNQIKAGYQQQSLVKVDKLDHGKSKSIPKKKSVSKDILPEQKALNVVTSSVSLSNDISTKLDNDSLTNSPSGISKSFPDQNFNEKQSRIVQEESLLNESSKKAGDQLLSDIKINKFNLEKSNGVGKFMEIPKDTLPDSDKTDLSLMNINTFKNVYRKLEAEETIMCKSSDVFGSETIDKSCDSNVNDPILINEPLNSKIKNEGNSLVKNDNIGALAKQKEPKLNLDEKRSGKPQLNDIDGENVQRNHLLEKPAVLLNPSLDIFDPLMKGEIKLKSHKNEVCEMTGNDVTVEQAEIKDILIGIKVLKIASEKTLNVKSENLIDETTEKGGCPNNNKLTDKMEVVNDDFMLVDNSIPIAIDNDNINCKSNVKIMKPFKLGMIPANTSVKSVLNDVISLEFNCSLLANQKRLSSNQNDHTRSSNSNEQNSSKDKNKTGETEMTDKGTDLNFLNENQTKLFNQLAKSASIGSLKSEDTGFNKNADSLNRLSVSGKDGIPVMPSLSQNWMSDKLLETNLNSFKLNPALITDDIMFNLTNNSDNEITDEYTQIRSKELRNLFTVNVNNIENEVIPDKTTMIVSQMHHNQNEGSRLPAIKKKYCRVRSNSVRFKNLNSLSTESKMKDNAVKVGSKNIAKNSFDISGESTSKITFSDNVYRTDTESNSSDVIDPDIWKYIVLFKNSPLFSSKNPDEGPFDILKKSETPKRSILDMFRSVDKSTVVIQKDFYIRDKIMRNIKEDNKVKEQHSNVNKNIKASEADPEIRIPLVNKVSSPVNEKILNFNPFTSDKICKNQSLDSMKCDDKSCTISSEMDSANKSVKNESLNYAIKTSEKNMNLKKVSGESAIDRNKSLKYSSFLEDPLTFTEDANKSLKDKHLQTIKNLQINKKVIVELSKNNLNVNNEVINNELFKNEQVNANLQSPATDLKIEVNEIEIENKKQKLKEQLEGNKIINDFEDPLLEKIDKLQTNKSFNSDYDSIGYKLADDQKQNFIDPFIEMHHDIDNNFDVFGENVNSFLKSNEFENHSNHLNNPVGRVHSKSDVMTTDDLNLNSLDLKCDDYKVIDFIGNLRVNEICGKFSSAEMSKTGDEFCTEKNLEDKSHLLTYYDQEQSDVIHDCNYLKNLENDIDGKMIVNREVNSSGNVTVKFKKDGNEELAISSYNISFLDNPNELFCINRIERNSQPLRNNNYSSKKGIKSEPPKDIGSGDDSNVKSSRSSDHFNLKPLSSKNTSISVKTDDSNAELSVVESSSIVERESNVPSIVKSFFQISGCLTKLISQVNIVEEAKNSLLRLGGNNIAEKGSVSGRIHSDNSHPLHAGGGFTPYNYNVSSGALSIDDKIVKDKRNILWNKDQIDVKPVVNVSNDTPVINIQLQLAGNATKINPTGNSSNQDETKPKIVPKTDNLTYEETIEKMRRKFIANTFKPESNVTMDRSKIKSLDESKNLGKDEEDKKLKNQSENEPKGYEYDTNSSLSEKDLKLLENYFYTKNSASKSKNGNKVSKKSSKYSLGKGKLSGIKRPKHDPNSSPADFSSKFKEMIEKYAHENYAELSQYGVSVMTPLEFATASKLSMSKKIKTCFDVSEETITSFAILNQNRKEKISSSSSEGTINIDLFANPILKEKYSPVPSVSKILNDTMSDASRKALDKWKIRMINLMGEEKFQEFHKEQLDRGKSFHESVKGQLMGKSETEKYKDNNCLKSIDWVLRDITDVVAVESFVVHPVLGYKGIFDCVAKYQGKLVMIEWKHSSKRKGSVSLTYDAPIQMAAYMGAISEDKNYNTVVDGGLVVVAHTDGSPAELFKLDQDLCQTYWTQWLGRLRQFIATRPKTSTP